MPNFPLTLTSPRTTLTLLACLPFLGGGLPAQALKNAVVLSGVILVDGTGAPPRPDVSLRIENGVFTHIVDGSLGDAANGADVVDLSGRYCVPGLMDVHTHLATAPSADGYTDHVHSELRRLLGSGITTVRDMGGDGRVLTYLARQTSLADVPGPDIHFAALLAGPMFFADARARSASLGAELGRSAWAHHVTAETDLDRLMQAIRGLGATGVKVYADLAPDLVTKVATAARGNDLQVWAHWVVAPRRTHALDVVQSGAQVVSHAYMLMHEAPPPSRTSSDKVLAAADGERLFEAMRTRGTILDATLIASTRLPTPPNYVSPRTCAADIVKAARAAGVLVATGSDHPGDDELAGIHLEYRLLVEDAGYEPLEVITAATRISALAIGIADSRGTIEVGKQATLLVLTDDPTTSVANLAKPEFVLVRGVLWSGAELRDVARSVRPLPEFPTSAK